MSKRILLFIILALLSLYALKSQAVTVSLGGSSSSNDGLAFVERDSGGNLESLGDVKIRAMSSSSNPPDGPYNPQNCQAPKILSNPIIGGSGFSNCDCPSSYDVEIDYTKNGVGTPCDDKYQAYSCKENRIPTSDDKCVCTSGYYEKNQECVACPVNSKCPNGIITACEPETHQPKTAQSYCINCTWDGAVITSSTNAYSPIECGGTTKYQGCIVGSAVQGTQCVCNACPAGYSDVIPTKTYGQICYFSYTTSINYTAGCEALSANYAECTTISAAGKPLCSSSLTTSGSLCFKELNCQMLIEEDPLFKSPF